jgi:glycerol-1-phosphate dehydrogenase [NAD(P)+]
MVQNGLRDYLARSAAAARGDADAVTALFEALAITGFSMQYLKTSRSVSGAEHLFSHVWEMADLSVNGVPVTHGHKVGIGTLAAAAFTEIFFADPAGPPSPAPGFTPAGPQDREAEVMAAFAGSRAQSAVVKTSLEKLPDVNTAKKITEVFQDSWKEIRSRVLDQLVPYGELKAMLLDAGCPVTPKEINLTRSEVIATSRRAQMIRNKYTVLDLAWDTGTFANVLVKMEESETYLK